MATDSRLLEEKFGTIDRLLEEDFLLVHVDSAAEGLTLPEHLFANSAITLKLSRFFRGALELSGDKVVADLLFGSSYFSCIIPLEAIWGVTSAKGSNIVWPENTPEDILKKMMKTSADDSPQASGSKKMRSPLKKGSHLKRIK